ncbi:ammonium transporter [Thiospirochaeta perfilievii]|uniref:Ammonium transporter n=1 Tax=Thiospirochaeta perfilievii TaxID=252967 RepID=A0A5C1QEL5_9SPIO|nr:ammonium transporter [Thiospirochaeta perfilievii]QEN05828.1 ammonium transporter [Thiospirochaeta perfilievii]
MKKIILPIFLLLGIGTSAFAEDASSIELLISSMDMIWLTLAAALVFFMQAGFAMVEIGLTRPKNAGNIIMKNLMDFAGGALIFWAVGWAIMYGKSYGGFSSNTFLTTDDSSVMRDWIFQVVFAATAATIVSGAMAERTKFNAYLVYSVVISGIIYPVFGSFTWGGGFLYEMGFQDFAGSTIVHSVGGWAALMGAIILGPRLGKYIKKDGKIEVKAIPGHNLPLAALGVFILWFGWFGFNAGSTLSGTDLSIAHVAVTTTLAASAGAIAAMFTMWISMGKPDVSMSLNGALAGLVGITAGTYLVTPAGAIIIGLLAGIIVVFSVNFFDRVLRIDDPVGAISVHGVCGAFGTLAVGLFANRPEDGVLGFFYGGGLKLLGAQAVGVLTAFGWVCATAGILFLGIKYTIGLRASKEEELKGLDMTEHGSESYPGFQIFHNV